MPVVIRKISPFCSLRLFSPTSLQRAKNTHFSLIFPEKSAFWNGFELWRFDVKKGSLFDFFLRFAVESSSNNFRFLPENSVSCGIDDKTRNQFGSNATWVRIPPSAPEAAPCGVLPFCFCRKLWKGCKVGFEQPVPGALRPAGLQQSCGLLQGRGRIPPPAPSITTQFYIG